MDNRHSMIQLLLISYHSLPMDVVSSYRTKAYCDYLLANNIYPTLITHRWENNERGEWKVHNEGDETIHEKFSTYEVYRLPRPEVLVKAPGFRSALTTFFLLLRGILDIELKMSYNVFKNFLFNHLREYKYDYVLAIYSPHYHLRLAYEIKNKFNLPYILDFRDLWDNELVTKSYSPGLRIRIIDVIKRYWWKKWIRDAIFFTTVSVRLKEWLEEMSGIKRGILIRNGFDEEINQAVNHPVLTDEFLVCHFGKLYFNQDLLVFVQGFESFLQKEIEAKTKLLIIGHKSRYGVDVERALAKLPVDSWEVQPYMTKSELFSFCKNRVSVFWMPGFHEDNGSFAVKVYDYLHLGKNILFAPGDGSDTQHVIEDSKAGVVCNTAEEVCNQLLVWYESFRNNGYVPYFGDAVVIGRYTRANQVKVLADYIHASIKV